MKKWIIILLIVSIFVLNVSWFHTTRTNLKNENARWQVLQIGRIELEEYLHRLEIMIDVRDEEIKKLKTPIPKLPEIIEIVPSFEDIIQETIDSVVHITNEDGGWQGSGVLIAPDLILTARHVAENSDSFTITLNNGDEIKAIRAISSKKYDLGFIKLDDPVDIKLAELASIKDCRLGQQIYVIGSPYGKVNFNSVTLGIVSGLGRNWGEPYGWEVSFTTDAAGHPGNSGCPVFTMDGKVRGILVGCFSPVLIGCMPMDLVMEDIDEIELMFTQNRYEFEEGVDYSLPGPGLGE